MRIFSFLIFFIVFIPSSFAFEKPNYCSRFYDPIYILANDIPDSSYVYKHPVEIPQVGGRPIREEFGVTVGQLKENSVVAEDAHLIASERIQNIRWLSQGLKLLINSSITYAGLVRPSFVPKNKSKAEKCMAEHVPSLTAHLQVLKDEQKDLNQGKAEFFLLDQLNNALLASSIMKYIEDREQVRVNKVAAFNDCQGAARGEQLSTKCRNAVKSKEQADKEFADETKGQSTVLSRLVKSKHLLFELKNDFEILNWFNSKVYLSPFAEGLLTLIPADIHKKAYDGISGELEFVKVNLNFADVRREVADAFQEINKEALSSSYIKGLWRDEYAKYLDKVYETVGFHCENSGEFLHYHTPIVDAMAERVQKREFTFQSDRENLRMFISFQGHQCRRWRDAPFEKSDRWTTQKVMGMGLLVFGVASAFVPGVGWIVTGGLIGSGTSMLMVQNYQDQAVAQINRKSYQFAYLNSWEDMRSLAIEVDRIADINSEYVMEGVFAAAGGAAQFFKVAERIFKNARHFENLKARGTGSAFERAQKLDDLITKRYEADPINPNARNGLIVRWIQRFNGNGKIPARLAKRGPDGEDYLTLIQTVSKKGGSPKLRDAAFEDLDEIIKQYRNHTLRRRQLIRRGENARAYVPQIDEYLTKLKPEHFRRNNPIDLPDFPNSDLLAWRDQAGRVHLQFKGVGLDNNGQFVDNDFAQLRFDSFEGLLARRDQEVLTYTNTFTQNAFEESQGLSDLSAEILAQPIRFMVLKTILRNLNLIADDFGTTAEAMQVAGLSLRQAARLDEIDKIVYDPDLLPRGDAFDSLMGEIARDEWWDLAFSALRRKFTRSKYASEISEGLGRLAARAVTVRLALLYGTFQVSEFSVAWVAQYNREVYRALHSYQATIRDLKRQFNKFIDFSQPPYGYTSAELKCMEESRSWTVENVCLWAELRKELWEEAYRVRTEPGYDVFKDAVLDRKMREYMRRYLANREHFGEGELFLKLSTVLPSVANDYTLQTSQTLIEEHLAELQGSAFSILSGLREVLQDPGNEEKLAKLKERIEKAETHDEVLGAFEEIAGLIENGFPNTVQAPGSNATIEAFIRFHMGAAKSQFERAN